MTRFVIERDIPGAGAMGAEQLQSIARTSCAVLDELGPAIRWDQSYVTADRVYCIYEAPDEAMVREHARRGGFPADRVSPVASVIGPATAAL